jgi:cytochrome P450
VQADIARMSTAAFRRHMEDTLAIRFRQARGRRRVDLVRDIVHPWATTMLVTLNGGEAIYSRRLAQICEVLFYGPAASAKLLQDPSQEPASRTRAPEQELDRMLDGRQLLLSKSMFFGLTQTMPSFLAKAWLALMKYPDQVARLVDNPKLMANATEELLRYAGLVHTLYRRSTRDLSIGDVPIKEGQLVILEIDSANFDPDRFEHAERLDVTRTAAGHLRLGSGLHACVGSFLVRMACSVATPMLLAARPLLAHNREVVWTGDRAVLWPMSVPIRFAATVLT